MLGRILMLAGLAALAAPCPAEESSPPDTIVVTATRSEISITEAIVPVTIIGRDAIEQSLATDLAELLRFEAGIDIARNGGPGQASSVFLRGTESNHTLVLIDGVRINPATIGGAPLQHVDPEVIERVEIVKGARSSLYGTDAIGGVINIITRRATDAYLETGAGGGRMNTRTGYVSGGGSSRSLEFGGTLNWQETDGYPPSRDSDVARGYRNLNASAYATRHFGTSDVTLRHWRAGGRVEYLDFFLTPLDQDFVSSSTALELNNRIGETGRSKLILSHTTDEIEQNQSADYVDSRRGTLDWQYSFDAGGHALAAGVYVADETASTASFGTGFEEDTLVRAVFVQDYLAAGPNRAFLAARYTDHESFGGELTWNAEYARDLGERWTLTAGIGHAFRAPDATDRYGFGGNADLRPEIADEVQLGAEFTASARQRIRIEYFRNDIDDLIEFDLDEFVLRNIGRAEIRGVQFGYEYTGEAFVVRADYLRQSADNATGGGRLLRRPEESLTLNYTQNLGPHRLGLSLLASGDRVDFAGSLPGFVLVNLTAQLAMTARWRANVRIENVLDTEYETAAGFPMQSRSAFAEISYHWQ